MLATCKPKSRRGKEYTTPFLNDFDLGYIAGLLDGEGCFHVSPGSQYVAVYSTDESILKYVQEVLEIGTIGKSGDNEKRGFKTCWSWRVQSIAGAFAVASMFEPVLLIKQEAARKLISVLKDKVEVVE